MTQILYVFLIFVEYIYLGKFNSEKHCNSSEDSTRTERFFSDDSYFTSVNPVRYQEDFPSSFPIPSWPTHYGTNDFNCVQIDLSFQTTWAVAKKDCMTVFGPTASLVSIESQPELDFLLAKLALTDSTGEIKK
jgi:hypothetical protein